MSKLKKKVLVLLPQSYTGNRIGGPVQSVANIVNNLGDDFDFFIISLVRNIIHDQQDNYDINNKWVKMGKAAVFTMPFRFLFIKVINLLKKRDYDALYVNSFFHPGSIFLLFYLYFSKEKINKVILAPRGEFSPGALNLKKTKKMLFIYFSRFIGLHKDVVWQATSHLEKQDILSVFSFIDDKDINVAPNIAMVSKRLTHLNIYNARPSKKRLRVIFLSRIETKKNLAFAIQAMIPLKIRVDFDVYGPVEDKKYWQLCQYEASKLPRNVNFAYKSWVKHSEVHELLSSYDLFILPTLGENYCHAIAESLSVGTPTLISNTTPWSNLESKGWGWDLPLRVTDFTKKLITYSQKTDGERQQIRNKVRQDMSSFLENEDFFIATKSLF